MSKLSISDDPFACVADNPYYARRLPPALLLALVPMLGPIGLVYGTQIPSSISASSGILTEATEGKPDRDEMRAGQLHDIETAHRNVIYWMQESIRPGAPGVLAQARQRSWGRAYKKRQALFTRMYDHGKA